MCFIAKESYRKKTSAKIYTYIIGRNTFFLSIKKRSSSEELPLKKSVYYIDFKNEIQITQTTNAIVEIDAELITLDTYSFLSLRCLIESIVAKTTPDEKQRNISTETNTK